MSLNVGTGKARRVGPLCTGKWNVGTDYGIQLGPLREIRQTPGLGKVCRDDNTACLGRSLQCNRSTMLAGGKSAIHKPVPTARTNGLVTRIPASQSCAQN